MHYIPERYGFRWFVIIFNSFKINILLRILLGGAISYSPFSHLPHISARKYARIGMDDFSPVSGTKSA